MQSVTILQIIGKGYWVYSRVGNLPPREKAPSMLLHRTAANEKYKLFMADWICTTGGYVPFVQ